MHPTLTIYPSVNSPNREPQHFTIDNEKLNLLQKIKQNIIQLVAIEEKYLMYIENHMAFELELFSFTNKNIYYGDELSKRHLESIFTFNRLFLNLLSSFKSYIDQIPQHLRVIDKNTGLTLFDIFNSKTHHIYDNYFDYEIFCALRNYTQHNNMPIHTIGIGIKVDESPFKYMPTLKSNIKIL